MKPQPPNPEEMTTCPHPNYANHTKHEWTLDCKGLSPSPIGSHTFHCITPDEINTCDTSRLMQDLRADLDNPLVKAGPGQLVLSVECDPLHPNGVFVKPEFSEFVKKADSQGVCWLYFVKPKSDILIKLCVAGSSGGKIEEINKNSITLTCSSMDLYVFIGKQLQRYYSLYKSAGISLKTANQHLKDLIEPLFPMFVMMPWSWRTMPLPQSLIDAYREVNPRYVPGKSVLSKREMISEIYLANLSK